MARKLFKTQDSALAYFINQLDLLDKILYQPLVMTSWARDLVLRPGVSMSNESTSYVRSTFAAPGSLSNPSEAATPPYGGNMPWVSAETDAIPGISIGGSRIVTPLRPLAREISYSTIELERSLLTAVPIDVQLIKSMNVLYQMNIDSMAYVGDPTVSSTGLLNSSAVTASNVPNGISGSPLWTDKTPDEILADVNLLLEQSWEAAAFAVCPGELRLPPFQFSYICSQKVSSAGNISILKFLEENSISLKINGKPLNVQPIKWLTDRGAGVTDRMMAYTNALDRVRFPMVPIRRETPYYRGIKYFAPYTYAFGEVEIVYPETIRYADGI